MEVALVWIVAIVSAAAVSITSIRARRQRALGEVSPTELLARRYAAGELTEAEYLMRLSILKDANELTT